MPSPPGSAGSISVAHRPHSRCLKCRFYHPGLERPPDCRALWRSVGISDRRDFHTRIWLMRNKNGDCRRCKDRPGGPAEEQFRPPRFRVAAHDQKIIVAKLDQLSKCFVFVEGRTPENIGDDFDTVIRQMDSQLL